MPPTITGQVETECRIEGPVTLREVRLVQRAGLLIEAMNAMSNYMPFHYVTALIIALMQIGCSSKKDIEDVVTTDDTPAAKEVTFVEFQSQLGNSIVHPSHWLDKCCSCCASHTAAVDDMDHLQLSCKGWA